MKVLLDTCVWGGVCQQLENAGYDVVWAGSWSEDPGDEEILARAYNEGRILVTLDKDFGELAIVQHHLMFLFRQVLGEQIRVIDKSRIIRVLGHLDELYIEELATALRTILGL